MEILQSITLDNATILTAVGTVMTTFLGIVAFFLKKIYDRFEKLCDKVDMLMNTMGVEQTKHDNLVLRVTACENSIKSLDEDVASIDKRVAIIEN